MRADDGTTDLTNEGDVALAERMKAGREQIIAELKKLIIGQDDVIGQVLLTLLVGGNSLIVGVPGLAKTLLIHSLAQRARPQVLPDPVHARPDAVRHHRDGYHPGRSGHRPPPDGLRARVRSSPTSCWRTRSTARRPRRSRRCSRRCRNTVSPSRGARTSLEEPFFVFATQNPIELEGTYPLPEAQLDRFMFYIVIDHPPENEEFEVVRTTTAILEPAVRASDHGCRSGRLPAAGATGSGGRAGHAVRARPGAHDTAEVRHPPRRRSRNGWRSAPASGRRST